MINFAKMEGLGNDYVYIDAIKQNVDNPSELAIKLSDRHFGIGGDGIILICKSDIADFKMRMFNQDGSEAQMCGNGIRCVGKFVYDKKLTDKTNIKIETLAGIKELVLHIQDEKVESVTVDMGEPILEYEKIPVNLKQDEKIILKEQDKKFEFVCVSMGNPHAVTEIDDVENFNLQKYGPGLEINSAFPEKENVEFVQIIDEKTIKMRVWERGTGETLACGTGACATAVACCLKGKTGRNVTVELIGGKLNIEWDERTNHVFMTGPAKIVFEGTIEI